MENPVKCLFVTIANNLYLGYLSACLVFFRYAGLEWVTTPLLVLKWVEPYTFEPSPFSETYNDLSSQQSDPYRVLLFLVSGFYYS